MRRLRSTSLRCKLCPSGHSQRSNSAWNLNPASSYCSARRCECNASRSRMAATIKRNRALPATSKTSMGTTRNILTLPRLNDFRKEHVAGFFQSLRRPPVSHTHPTEVDERQHATHDEQDVTRQSEPFNHPIGRRGDKLQRSSVVIAAAH